MGEFLTAVGLVLVIEGLLYAAFPDAMRRALALVLSLPAAQVRAVGLGTAALGLLCVWLVRG